MTFSKNNLLPVTIASAFVAVVSGQTHSFHTQNLCPGLFNNANATGEQPRNEVDKNGVFNYYGQWKVSVRSNYSVNSIEFAESTADGNNPDAIANVWLDPKDGVDLNSGEVFSACAYVYKNLPANTLRRGQQDDGTCVQMLSKSCVEEITTRAALTAQYLVQTPTLGPYSNLTVSPAALCQGYALTRGSRQSSIQSATRSSVR